jgi:hypothetical protein
MTPGHGTNIYKGKAVKIVHQKLFFTGLLFGATLLLSACGGGGGGDDGNTGGTGPNKTGDDVADTLTNLGVDTSQTPRTDNNAEPLPDSFTPLGKNKTLQKKSEMFTRPCRKRAKCFWPALGLIRPAIM